MEENTTTQYITTTRSGTTTGLIQITGSGVWESPNSSIGFSVSKKSGIHPELYFKYIKSKFGALEKMKLDSRLKRLEKAFLSAVESGQEALGEKILKELSREARESVLYAKGIKYFIEKADLDKHKRNIRGGHISDTKFDEFTRIIPADVLRKKKAVEGVFDGFVIYHVWDEKVEEKRTKKQKMSPEEKEKMKDPVLFGVIRETNRMYFIADWIDELCDLSFEEIIDELGKEEGDHKLSRDPKFNFQ